MGSSFACKRAPRSSILKRSSASRITFVVEQVAPHAAVPRTDASSAADRSGASDRVRGTVGIRSPRLRSLLTSSGALAAVRARDRPSLCARIAATPERARQKKLISKRLLADLQCSSLMSGCDPFGLSTPKASAARFTHWLFHCRTLVGCTSKFSTISITACCPLQLLRATLALKAEE